MTGHDGNCIFILFIPNLQVENDLFHLHSLATTDRLSSYRNRTNTKQETTQAQTIRKHCFFHCQGRGKGVQVIK